MGPIGVKAHLAPFLPKHPLAIEGTGDASDYAIAGAPFGSSLITTISWSYMRMMGAEGLRNASKYAILNANYMAARLAPHYRIRFKGKNGRVAHEFILDLAPFRTSAGETCED